MHITMNRLLLAVAVLLTALTAVAQQAPTSPVTLKGPTMGAVTFSHSAHLRVAAKCEVCHHPSKPEKPLKSAQQACTDCHTRPPDSASKDWTPGGLPQHLGEYRLMYHLS